MADSSGFVFEKDEKLSHSHLLKISPEFTALEKVLNSSGLSGYCKLTILPKTRLGLLMGSHSIYSDYSLAAQQIQLTIYNLNPNNSTNILDILNMFESMNIAILKNSIYTREMKLSINNVIEDIPYNEYEYLTEAGRKISEILQKEGVVGYMDNLKKLSHKMVFFTEQEMQDHVLVQTHERLKTVGRGNYSLNVNWPHDATKGFLPTLEIILKRLVGEKLSVQQPDSYTISNKY